MTSTINNKTNLKPITIRFAVKRNYILYPIESIELMTALARSNTGYLVMPPRGVPKAPIGARLDAVGIIARKGTTSVDYDHTTQVIGIEGPVPQEVVSIMSEIESIVQRDLKVDISKNVRFYEIMANFHMDTGNNPLKILGKFNQPKEVYDSISEIINERITNEGIHISSVSDTIETPEWFDMNIIPLPNKSSTTYDITVIFRRKEREAVSVFLTSIESIIQKIISTIEDFGKR
jgi:hypothetical protein